MKTYTFDVNSIPTINLASNCEVNIFHTSSSKVEIEVSGTDFEDVKVFQEGEQINIKYETFYISRKHYFSKWIFESEAGIGYQIGDTFDWFKLPKSSKKFKPVRSGGDYTHYARVEKL